MDQALRDALNQILGSKSVLVLSHFAVGIGLMYLIDEVFKFIEDKLTDDTKLAIAVWLVGVETVGKGKLGPTTVEGVSSKAIRPNPTWRRVPFVMALSVGALLLGAVN